MASYTDTRRRSRAGDESVGMRHRRLLLVGGGHAHLEVLRQFAARPLAGADVTLVTPHPLHRYSSSMPAVLCGQFPDGEGCFALDVLAQRAGARLLLGAADAIEGGAAPRVRVHGEWIDADLLSLDIGSAPSIAHVAGAAAHAHHVRSFPAWQALRNATDALFAARDSHGTAQPRGATPRVVVVGAGASGVELALALAERARRTNAPVQVTLVEAERQLPARTGGRDVLGRLLDRAEVRCIFDARVIAVAADAVQLDGGRVLDAALTIWVAGAASPQALRASPSLPLTHDGFLRVNASLQAVDGAPIFGAGDCVAIDGEALDKAGVYAVRQAPILARNLRAAIATQLGGAGTLRGYRPQRRYLSILDTSDGQALLTWGGWAYHTKWALPLKRWLDARFVARYRPATHRGDTRVPPHAPRLARLRAIGAAFAAGAATILMVHQPLVWSAHAWVGTPWIAFSTAATRPFGVPALVSAMAWGGAWVALLSRWWQAGRRGSAHHPAQGGGISTLAAAISCALIPTAVGAILTSRGTTFPPLGEHPWRAAVAALVINGAWGWSAGALLSAWRSRRAVASPGRAAEGGPTP